MYLRDSVSVTLTISVVLEARLSDVHQEGFEAFAGEAHKRLDEKLDRIHRLLSGGQINQAGGAS